MVPASAISEALWKIVMGLLFGVVLGGFGVGLLAWAAWQWLVQRPQISQSPDRPTTRVPKEGAKAITEFSSAPSNPT